MRRTTIRHGSPHRAALPWRKLQARPGRMMESQVHTIHLRAGRAAPGAMMGALLWLWRPCAPSLVVERSIRWPSVPASYGHYASVRLGGGRCQFRAGPAEGTRKRRKSASMLVRRPCVLWRVWCMTIFCGVMNHWFIASKAAFCRRVHYVEFRIACRTSYTDASYGPMPLENGTRHIHSCRSPLITDLC